MPKHSAVSRLARFFKSTTGLVAAVAIFFGTVGLSANFAASAGNCYTETSDGNGNTVVSFTDTSAPCDWVVPAGVTTAHVLIVGGGGGGGIGGSNAGGGGGGGGKVHEELSVGLTPGQTMSAVVGAGGTGGYWDCSGATDGSLSSFGMFTAGGGGAGGSAGGTGGCGTESGSASTTGFAGGSAVADAFMGAPISLSGTQSASNAAISSGGGVGYFATGECFGYMFCYGAGGGGAGAGASGQDATDNSSSWTHATAGHGGEGVSKSITGSAVVYASGGGGGDLTASASGGTNGGKGGSAGADIYDASLVEVAFDGVANTGSGGGGAGPRDFGKGGNGGSGVVIVSYSSGPTTPNSPTMLVGTGGNGNASIAFTAPSSDGGSTITNYEYSIDGGTWNALSPADATSPVTIPGLTNGTSYSVALRAVNGVGSGSPSAPIFVTPTGPTRANAPTSVSATGGNGQATVTFTAPSDNGGATITNYEYQLDGGTWAALSPSDATSPITIPSLTNGTTYSVAIRAVTSAGSGTASSGVSVTPSGPPGIPTGLTINSADKALQVACTNPSNGGSAITNYQFSTDNGTTWLALSPSDASCPLTINSQSSSASTALVNGTPYDVKLKAVNVNGASTASDAARGTPATIPAAPTSLTVTPGNASITVGCAAASTVAANGGKNITDYEYSLNGGTTFVSTGSTACPFTISGLTNGTSYNVVIRAINAMGSGTNSVSSAAVVPRTVADPPVLTNATPGNAQATITFNAPANNGGSAITSYQYSINGGSTWVTTSPAIPSGSITITGLTNGTAYGIVMRSVNAAGNSIMSNSLNVTPRTVPAAPTALSATVTSGQAVISFTPNSDGGSTLTNIEYSIDGGTNWVTPSPAVTASPLTITGLTDGTTYSIKLREVNAAGTGPASTAVSATPGATPTPTPTPTPTRTSSPTPTRTSSPSPSSSSSRSPSASPSSTRSASATPTPTPSPSLTKSPTPSPTRSIYSSKVYEDVSEVTDNIKDERDKCDKEVTRSVCNKETDEHLRDALDSTKEKSKERSDDLDNEIEKSKKDSDDADKKEKDSDDKADKSEKDAKDKDDKADKSEKDSKDKDDKADKSEKDAKDKDGIADKSEKESDDKDHIADSSEKDAKDKDVKADKSDAKADKEEKDSAKTSTKTDDKQADLDREKADKDRELADEAEKKAKKDRDDADEAEKKAKKDRDDADAAEAKAKKDRDDADEAEKKAKKDRDDADEAEKKAKKDRDDADQAAKEAEEKHQHEKDLEDEKKRLEETQKRLDDLEDEHKKLSDSDNEEEDTEKDKRDAVADLYPGAQLKYVSICHATASEDNPYVNVTVPTAAWDELGHGTHTGNVHPTTGWGDIIPGVSGLTAMNMDMGQSIYDNLCLVEAQVEYVASESATPIELSGASPSDSESSSATSEPSSEPTTDPTQEATSEPSASSEPSNEPTTEPSATNEPTSEPSESASASESASESATEAPSASPSETASESASESPSDSPSETATDSPSSESTPTESLPPADVPETIDDVTEYEEISKEYHDQVVENLANEIELIDELLNTGEPLPLIPTVVGEEELVFDPLIPQVLIDGIKREQVLKAKLAKLWPKIVHDRQTLTDPQASEQLMNSTRQMLSRVFSLRELDLALSLDRAGKKPGFPWWIVWVAAGSTLVLASGAWLIIAYRRKRVFIDVDACTSCGLCYERFPELFAKGPAGKAVIRQESTSSGVMLYGIPKRKHQEKLKNFIKKCKDGAIGYSRKVPKRIKDQERKLNGR